MVALLIVVAAAAPSVSVAAGREVAGQPGRPTINVGAVTPKVTVAAQPKDHRVAVDVNNSNVVVHAVKKEPKLSDKVSQERVKPVEAQSEVKQDQEESGKEKPRKMVLKVDLWGNVRLVPEEPGC